MNDTQQQPVSSTAHEQQAATPPPPPVVAPLPPSRRRRLVRTLDDKWLSGVCGGLARYANVDATIVRVLAVVLGVVFFPISVLAYLVLWLVIPTQ